jgi:hypothetical protein
MSLRVATEVTAERQVAESDETPPSSRILVNGTPSAVVSGAQLEAAVECDGRFLLFMTDDTPFEEVLSIHLVSSDGHLLDSATLGGPYTTGTFSGLSLNPPNRVGFRFIGEADWSIEILADSAFRLPLRGDAPGVRRALGFSRHFVVHGNPAPAAR